VVLVYFSSHGLQAYKRRVANQEEKVRELGEAVGEAAGPNCDWHDNFEFEEARRRLELESRILRDMHESLASSQIVAIRDQDATVAIGVTVEATVNGEPRLYTIGAFGETATERGLVAYNSPIAKALIGLKAGQSRNAKLGSQQVHVVVQKIYPPSYRYCELVTNP
jgi:transcription elongation GreA/GreB family factor